MNVVTIFLLVGCFIIINYVLWGANYVVIGAILRDILLFQHIYRAHNKLPPSVMKQPSSLNMSEISGSPEISELHSR